MQTPLITNDATVLGIIMSVLAFVFYTAKSSSAFWQKFYSIVPSILLVYFIPALLNTFGIISGAQSNLYHIASRYLLPTSLLLLTIGIDFPSLLRLGPKALIMFFVGSFGVAFGALFSFGLLGSLFPQILNYNGEETWRGFATIVGAWIGGGANQAAVREVFNVSGDLFSQMVTADVIIANLWLGALLYMAPKREKIDRWLKADSSAITTLQKNIEHLHNEKKVKETGISHWMLILGVGFAVTGLSHYLADVITPWISANHPEWEKYSLTSTFFWLVIIATSIGILLSFTKAQHLERIGASEFGTLFLYVLIATIGMEMDIKAILQNPLFFLVTGVWIIIHGAIMFAVARIIHAPLFYIAVASQANIGGAGSAPIIAAAFNRYLAPVGVLLAILGYAIGTYAAYLTGLAMQWMSGKMG